MTTTARRMTAQRAEILAELRSGDGHPTAAELHERLRRRLPRLSLGTVYRNLDLLVAAGEAAKLLGTGDSTEARYDSTATPHHHARCRGCGHVADIPVQANTDVPGLPPGFVIERCRLEYVGLCASCRAAEGAH